MGHRKAVPAHLLQRGLYLKHATGIGGDDHLRPGLQDVVRLALTELRSRFGLDHVVDARGPAADLGFTDLLYAHTGYLLEGLARLLTDSLCVRQMAGVVVGRRNGQRISLGHGAKFLKELRDIADIRAENLRPLRVLRVVTQQVSVLLHSRAAARGVDDDVVQVQALEGIYGLAGEVQRLLLAARVCGEGAAATLFGGHHLATFCGQDADRSGVDVGEENPLHAARQDTDPAALLAYRARQVRDLLFLRQIRQEGLHSAHPGRDALHDAGPAQLIPDPEALVEAHRGCDGPKAVGIGEELEDHLPEGLIIGPSLVAALDLLARGLDELVVLHAGRAGRNAGHAPQAQIPVADHLVVHRLLVEALVHQVDAPARGVHLFPEQHVSRARRQAEAAMHALVYEVLVRRMVVIESRERVAAALGTVLAHGVLQGVCSCREGALPHVLRAPGADGPSHSVLACRPLVAPALGGVHRVVAAITGSTPPTVLL